MDSKQYKEIIRPFYSDKRFRSSVYVAEEVYCIGKQIWRRWRKKGGNSRNFTRYYERAFKRRTI